MRRVGYWYCYWARYWAATDVGSGMCGGCSIDDSRGGDREPHSVAMRHCAWLRGSAVLPSTTVATSARDVDATNRGKQVVKKRRRTLCTDVECTLNQREPNKSMKRVQSQSLKWTSVARQQYINAQEQYDHGETVCAAQTVFGRGEGGGVT